MTECFALHNSSRRRRRVCFFGVGRRKMEWHQGAGHHNARAALGRETTWHRLTHTGTHQQRQRSENTHVSSRPSFQSRVRGCIKGCTKGSWEFLMLQSVKGAASRASDVRLVVQIDVRLVNVGDTSSRSPRAERSRAKPSATKSNPMTTKIQTPSSRCASHC